MSVIRIIVIQFHRTIRENTVLTVIVHPIQIKIYLLYLLTYLGRIFILPGHKCGNIYFTWSQVWDKEKNSESHVELNFRSSDSVL